MQLHNPSAVRAWGIAPNGHDVRGVVGIDRDCKVTTDPLLTEGEWGVDVANRWSRKHGGWRAGHHPVSQSFEAICSTVIGPLDNDLRRVAIAIGVPFDKWAPRKILLAKSLRI